MPPMGMGAQVSELGDRISKTLQHPYVAVGFLVALWFTLGTLLSFYNKLLLGHDHDKHIMGEPFPAPLFMSGVQFAMQHLLARAVFGVGLVTRDSRDLTWRQWVMNVWPNGTCTGLDIGFSNMSLVFISLSFYTMCKATVPIFLLLFAFAWGLETPTWRLGGVVTTICIGLALLVSGEADFHMAGFLLVMTAACLSGLRFTLTQVFLQGSAGKSALGGPLEVLCALTPVMAATVLSVSLVWERLWVVLPASAYFRDGQHCLMSLGLIGIGAIIAFLLVWTEYKLICETSALTFMIAGTLKEIVTVLAAVVFLGDKFGWINALGLGVVIAGVVLFKFYKLEKVKKGITILPVEVGGRGQAGDDRDGDAELEMEPLIVAAGGGDSSRADSVERTSGSASGVAPSSTARLPGSRSPNVPGFARPVTPKTNGSAATGQAKASSGGGASQHKVPLASQHKVPPHSLD